MKRLSGEARQHPLVYVRYDGNTLHALSYLVYTLLDTGMIVSFSLFLVSAGYPVCAAIIADAKLCALPIPGSVFKSMKFENPEKSVWLCSLCSLFNHYEPDLRIWVSSRVFTGQTGLEIVDDSSFLFPYLIYTFLYC